MQIPNILKSLKRRQIRYLLFRTRDTQGISKDEVQKILNGWGFNLTRRQAGKEYRDIVAYYESLPNFTGWKNFASYDAVGWDIGIESNDIATKLNRPEKWWLFDKSRHDITIRGVKVDSKTMVELETGVDSSSLIPILEQQDDEEG